jgi:hypothetical protein
MFDGVAMLSLRGAHEHGPTDIGSFTECLREREYTSMRRGRGTDTKLGGYDVAPREWIDAFRFGCLLHLETMLVRACKEHHGSRRVQYALKPRDDVRGDERVEVANVRALRATSASGSNEATLGGLTRVGVKYGRGDIEWFVGALRRVVPSDGEDRASDCRSRECERL